MTQEYSNLTPDGVEKAMGHLRGIVNLTPTMSSTTLDKKVGGQVFLKCENFQKVGAFKFRGAYNAISKLPQSQLAKGVITHSSGNHAQGVALASAMLDVEATIVMPENSTPVKMAATAGYGATVVKSIPKDREKISGELAEKHGYTLIHPYDHEDIIFGQGTAAWELFDQVGDLDFLFVPVGGGGLISGCALATAVRSSNCKVIGVEPVSGDDAGRSWRSGNIVSLDDVPNTIADGVRTRFIGDRNHAVMQKYVHDMTTVTETQILDALQFIWSRMKIVVEPSSALALAPILSGEFDIKGGRAGILISGGNVNVPGCGFFH
ncbi:MAG: pyridoxal-phosphate dependent enzyme [Anaerolineae bacterium]